jgi:site-specific DNA recombinase
MKRIAALYARVSTLQQEQEATIDSQVAAIEVYAQANDCCLSKDYYFLDQAVSGAQFDRPALNRLRDLAPEGLFDVVLCLSPDRLARQYAHQWVLLNELQQVGVKVIFINQPPIENNPQGQLLLGIQGLFSEYERAMITERLRRGKLYKVRQGQLINPVAPYGYRYIPVSEPGGGRWEIDPIEAEVVGQIFDWYTGDKHLTIWEIVAKLTDLGQLMPPRGAQWRFSTVESILRRADYTGQAYYNRTQANHDLVGQPRKRGRGKKLFPVRVVRPKDEWIAVSVPAILKTETWQRAQERLKMNQKFASRNNQKHFYLLRSLLVCNVCGRTLVGRTMNGRIFYHCTDNKQDRRLDVARHTCTISGEVIEPLVWQAVIQLIQNPRLIEDAWQSQSETQIMDPDEVERLQVRLKTLERQWQRLLDIYQEEKLDKSELIHRKKHLDQER